MGAPPYDRSLSVVIVRKIVFRFFDRFSCLFITYILVFQSIWVIFGMACDKYLLALFCHNGIYARFLTFGKNFKLLMRLYDPTDGKILLDGIDIREYDTEKLYDMYGIIFQDFGKYADTAAENIRFGDVRVKHTDADIENAAIASRADAFIKELPVGYQTPLTRMFEDDGIELSGGQWQKLSIARAFYKKSDILIMDEPTASLDPLAEQDVFNRFSELSKGKISVFVSHRLSGAITAGKIIVLEDGCIAEMGTHDDLMGMRGKYHLLFTTQAKRYMDSASL